MYSWEDIANRTEVVYRRVMETEEMDLWTRIMRYAGAEGL